MFFQPSPVRDHGNKSRPSRDSLVHAKPRNRGGPSASSRLRAKRPPHAESLVSMPCSPSSTDDGPIHCRVRPERRGSSRCHLRPACVLTRTRNDGGASAYGALTRGGARG